MLYAKYTKLSEFLTDCRDGEDVVVGVYESQLRAYAQTCAKSLTRIKELEKENAKLKAKNDNLKLTVDALKTTNTLDVIDLLA